MSEHTSSLEWALDKLDYEGGNDISDQQLAELGKEQLEEQLSLLTKVDEAGLGIVAVRLATHLGILNDFMKQYH